MRTHCHDMGPVGGGVVAVLSLREFPGLDMGHRKEPVVPDRTMSLPTATTWVQLVAALLPS
jgi:hypothetical protein